MWIKRKKQEENEGLPVFRKRFTAAENVVRCELRITATGIFDVKINGYEIPDRFMPGWTNYRKRIDVCTYDVTDHIGKDNVIAVTVANGWYSGKLGYGNNVNVFGDKKRLFAELTVFYADGTTETNVIFSEKAQSVYDGGGNLVREFSVKTIIDRIEAAGDLYFYSEIEPTKSGNFWHYENGEPVIW